MRRRPPRVRGFYTIDNYAATALNMHPLIGSSMADARIHNAKEMFAFMVIPDIDEDSIEVRCSDSQIAASVSETLFGWDSRRDLWDQPNMAMELRSWVAGMISYRDVYIHFELGRVDDKEPWDLIFVGWLPPATVLVRGRGVDKRYEQFVSKYWPGGEAIVVEGGPREFLWEFASDEIVHLRWPLGEPDRRLAPEAAARRAGRAVDRYARDILASARAGAEPDETFLPIARGRAGAYREALDGEKLHDAVVGDRLFLPPDDEITEYFFVERLIRSRIAACEVRAYLLSEVSRQLLGPWAVRNNWPKLEMRLRKEVWSVADWRSLHEEYKSGSATVEDLIAATLLE